MKPPRGIFVKLVTVFLLVGLAPFLVIGLSAYRKAKAQMTETVMTYWLVRTARETAVQLDREVQELRGLLRSWADDAFLAAELLKSARGEDAAGRAERLCAFLDNRRTHRRDLDLTLLVGVDGSVLAESWCYADGSAGTERRLFGRRIGDLLPDPGESRFIQDALAPGAAALRQPTVPLATRDWHVSPLVRLARGQSPWNPATAGWPKAVNAYGLGLAATVLAGRDQQPAGALVAIFNWSRIQGVLDLVGARFKDVDDPLRPGIRYSSGYPFLFLSDLDTICAHDNKANLGTSLTRDHHLEAFQARLRQADYGSFQYEYPRGTRKISGFARTAPQALEGFGWMVGVGINYDQIFADVATLRDFLVVSALIATGLVILMAAMFSHRIVEPITRLIAYTEQVARGNLDARVDIRTNDEIAVLADSFNKMAEDLKESNLRRIKAEKDAAWKEMASQVAHEIKNPLTPIMLSVQQLRKAHADRHPALDDILRDSVDTIIDQCESLRRIAADFAAFATFPRRTLQPEDIGTLVRAAVDLYRPRLAADVEVTCQIDVPPGTSVHVDKDELRRVFLNLFNNAMEAMAETGGRLAVRAAGAEDHGRPMVRIEVSDTGQGIPEESRHRLFEPYFSTRTGGTGLGLAICKRVVEDLGGTIAFTSERGKGTTFIIALPAQPPA